MDREEIQGVLEGCEFFSGLEKGDLEKVGALCRVATYQPGEVVFRQGDFGDRIYVIAEGRVTLERAVDLGVKRGRAVIGVLGRGRVMGCWSTLLDEPHTFMASAVCQKETKIVAMKGRDLRAIMLADRVLGFTILERLCRVLRERIQGVYGAMERV